MGKLVFRVASDWQEVVRLRTEIEKLKQTLLSMDSTRSPDTFKKLNMQLGESTKKMNTLVYDAAKAGAEIEGNFKKKIFDASQTVNGLTEKIIAQKAIVKDTEADVRRLGEAYRIALKRNPLSANSKLADYTSAKKALNEDKAALFDLTQQQAEARLSVKKLRDEYALYKDDAKAVAETNNGIAISWKKALAVIGGAGVLKALGSEMIRVRGEFQSMQTAIETMVGKDMAGQLIPQIKELAKISPLTMSDMVDAEKMMLGFNIQAGDTIKYLKALSDISMGESSKFHSLTLAFSQMSAAGKLMGQDLNQMINAGFNPLQIISEKTGKSIATLKDEMSKGAISAEMVQQAFIDATSAGGRFYQMSENASKTINGQLSMMQDSIDAVFDELGTKSEGVIMSGIQMTTSLIENYETVGKVLAGLVVTYGTYRTAVMLTTIATSKHTIAEVTLTNARVLARKAQMALNAAMLTNPYVLLATAVVGLGAAMWTFHDSATEAEKAQRRFNEQQEEAKKREEEHKQKIASLIQSSRDIALSDLQRGQSLAELRREYPKIFEQYDIESIKLADILKLKQQIAEEDEKRAGEKQKQDFTNLESEITYYENLLKSLAGQQGVDGYVKKLKDLRADRDILLEERSNGISEQFISSLKDIDISEFDRYISELEKRIKGKGENGKIKMRLPIDVKGSLSDEALFEVKDIKALIDTAKSTKQSRIDAEKNQTTYQQDLAKAKEDWEVAKKGYEALLKDQLATSKQVKDAKDKMVTAEEKYKDLGGITGSSLTKQENQAKKKAEEQRKQQEQLSEQLLSLRRKNQQDEINLMKEGSEKKLAQIDLDYQKELDAIEKQRDEWNKSQKGKLTDEQETQLFTSEENAFKIYEKNVKEVNEAKLEADRKAWQEYFIEFGNYQEKRKNLIQQYDDEIAKLQMDSPEYASKTAEKGQALEQLDEKFGKSTKTMADLFEDASNKSVSAIQSIIDKYETLVKYMSGTKKSDGTDVTLDELKSVGFTDSDIERLENGEIKIKDVIDAIKGLKNELKEKSPWQSFRTELGKGIDTIKNSDGDTQKLGQGITDIGNAVTSFIPALSEFGSNIANIFGVDDSKITGIIDAVGGLGQTAVGVGQIMSGDIFGGAMSAVSGISSIVSALDGLFGADYSHYNAMKERYDTLNEIWDELISKKKEYIDISYGTEALRAGEEALDIIKKSQDAQRNLARTLAQSGASAGSHSIAYRQNAALGGYASELYRYVHQNGNYNDITNALLGASAEQLQKVKEQMPELWAGLDGDFREHLNNIISGAEQAKEVLEQMKEAVAGISFDEFRSGYIDLLSDLDSTNEDFADNFEKYLQKSIFESLLANKYKERIQALYDTWVEYGKDGLTPDEVQKLRDMQEQLSESLLAERDKIMSDFGFTTNGSESKSSTSKGFSTMSQDTGEELNGRFTALQIAGEEIKNQNAIQVQSLNLLTMKSEDIFRVNTETRNIADDTRDLIAQSYLELVQISENTGNSAKYLKDIKADIAAVKKNTAGLAP